MDRLDSILSGIRGREEPEQQHHRGFRLGQLGRGRVHSLMPRAPEEMFRATDPRFQQQQGQTIMGRALSQFAQSPSFLAQQAQTQQAQAQAQQAMAMAGSPIGSAISQAMSRATPDTPKQAVTELGEAATGFYDATAGQVGRHFHIDEFKCRGTGTAKVSAELVRRLDMLRDELGSPIVITSGYRSPEHNRAVGGAARSRHVSGEAADIVAPGVSLNKVYELAKKYFGDGGIGIYDGHVHVDVGPQRRWDRRG